MDSLGPDAYLLVGLSKACRTRVRWSLSGTAPQVKQAKARAQHADQRHDRLEAEGHQDRGGTPEGPVAEGPRLIIGHLGGYKSARRKEGVKVLLWGLQVAQVEGKGATWGMWVGVEPASPGLGLPPCLNPEARLS